MLMFAAARRTIRQSNEVGGWATTATMVELRQELRRQTGFPT
jgi:hypothetical protein